MTRYLMLGIMLTLGFVMGVTSSRLLDAQPTPIKFTNLFQADLVGIEGMEILVSVVEFSPKATIGRHTHPGHEVAYVLEGSGVSEIEGHAPELRKTGTVTYIPPKKVHESKNESATEPMKVLYVRIHPKGQPVIDSRLTEPSFIR